MKNRLLIGGDDKIELLRHLIQRDFPTGVTVIDTTGHVAEAIARSTPEELTDQVQYFDPSDAKHIASFNVFYGVPKAERPKLVQDICAFFDALFPAGAETLTRLYGNYVLANVLTILLRREDVSFLSVLEFLTDTAFRARCLTKRANRIAVRNWKAIEEWEPALRKQAFANVETKVGTLLLSPVMYRTLQDEPTFFLGKTPIFIANLSRQKLGDSTARLLGTLLISRANTPVYITDFGFLSSAYLASLFSYGGYTVAVQSLSELSDPVKQAVLGFEEKYVFRTTPDDAETLQSYMSGVLNPSVLVDLSPKEFLPKIDLDPPLARRRLRAVRNRSNACHTRRAGTGRSRFQVRIERPAKPVIPSRKRGR